MLQGLGRPIEASGWGSRTAVRMSGPYEQPLQQVVVGEGEGHAGHDLDGVEGQSEGGAHGGHGGDDGGLLEHALVDLAQGVPPVRTVEEQREQANAVVAVGCAARGRMRATAACRAWREAWAIAAVRKGTALPHSHCD